VKHHLLVGWISSVGVLGFGFVACSVVIWLSFLFIAGSYMAFRRCTLSYRWALILYSADILFVSCA
jgi:hypothetical protein